MERYCSDGKLDCFHDPDEDRYYATPGSVGILIGQLKEIQARHAPVPEAVGEEKSESTEVPRGKSAEKSDSAAARELEREVLDLKIANRAKDLFIEQMKAERKELAQEYQGLVLEFGKAQREIGELNAKVRQLEAPKPETENLRPAPVREENHEPERLAS